MEWYETIYNVTKATDFENISILLWVIQKKLKCFIALKNSRLFIIISTCGNNFQKKEEAVTSPVSVWFQICTI